MIERITVRNHLNLENFNPLDIEISEFKELSDAMPKDANIDISIAENLAAKFLKAADRCSEILSTLILAEGKAKSLMSSVKGRLYLQAAEEGHKTVKEREAYSESHEDYISAVDAFNEMHGARRFFDLKQKWFVEAHHLMKQRLRGEYRHQNASGFSETSGEANEKSWGEKTWT